LVYEGKSKMSERPTPETDSFFFRIDIDWDMEVEFARKLERERDDYMERCRTALSERDSWRMRAEQKYAMRRELEELLGVDQKDASDEQFQKGLDAIKNIIGERDEAREEVKELIYIAERGIALAEIDFENDKFGVVSELRDGLERIKEGAK
jgi:hypothetical protein